MIAPTGRRGAVGMMVAAILASVAAGPVTAQDEPTLEIVGSDAYLPRNIEVAEEWLLVRDPLADQVDPAGTPLAGAPPWLDVTAAFVADTRLVRPFRNFIERNHGESTADAWHSRESDELEAGDPVLITIIDLAGPIPATFEGDLQLVIGTDNDERAWPVAPGMFASADHGNRVVTANGAFATDDGVRVLARATDLLGQDPAAAPERDNERYRAVGWISRDRDRIVHVQRTLGRPPTASIRLEGEAGGQRFVDVIGPAPRIPLADPVPTVAITCASLGVFPADPEAADADGPVELRVVMAGPGVGALADGAISAELLAAGSEAPVPVEGRLEKTPDAGTATLSFAVVPQRYLDIVIGDPGTGGGPPIDLRRLIGTGGIDAGTGTFGIASGDPRCGGAGAAEAA